MWFVTLQSDRLSRERKRQRERESAKRKKTERKIIKASEKREKNIVS